MSDDTVPSTHTAGDSTAWQFDAGACLPSAGWTAQLVLIGPARITVACGTSGDTFTVAANSATTAAWAPGDYALRLLYTKAGERQSRDLPGLRILPDPAAGGTTADSLLSAAQKHLADLEAAYRAHMSSGSAVVAEYRIGDRMRRFKDVADLLAALNAARRDVQAEESAAALAAGGSSRRRFVVRM